MVTILTIHLHLNETGDINHAAVAVTIGGYHLGSAVSMIGIGRRTGNLIVDTTHPKLILCIN